MITANSVDQQGMAQGGRLAFAAQHPADTAVSHNLTLVVRLAQQ